MTKQELQEQQAQNIKEIKSKIHGILEKENALDLEKVIFKIAGPESNWDSKITNPKGGAFGLFQFTGDNRKNMPKLYHNLAGMENDSTFTVEKQVMAMVHLTRDNEKELKRKFGEKFEMTDGVRYLAHFAGSDATSKILLAAPDTLISSILSPLAMKNNADIYLLQKGKDGKQHRLDFKDFTTNDLKVWANRKMAQPDGYELMSAEARAKYRKDNNISDSIPDAIGDMVMTIINNVVKIIAAIGNGVGGIFSGNAETGSNLSSPQTPPTNIASSKSPSPAG